MLALFENAIDALRTGMKVFRDKNMKFAIILFVHSIELLLTELLSRHHQMLIYSNVNARITRVSSTVRGEAAIVRLCNVGVRLTKDEKDTIRALKERSSEIVNHRFVPLKDDHDRIGQSLKFIVSFVAKYLHDDLGKHLDAELLQEIEGIVSAYDEQLAIFAAANHEFEQWADKTFDGGIESDEFQGTFECPICCRELLVLREPTIGNYCFFCRSEVDALECEACYDVVLRVNDGEICDDCKAHC